MPEIPATTEGSRQALDGGMRRIVTPVAGLPSFHLPDEVAPSIVPEIADFLKADRDAEKLSRFAVYRPLISLWQAKAASHTSRGEHPSTFRNYLRAIARRHYNEWAPIAKRALSRRDIKIAPRCPRGPETDASRASDYQKSI
jgi:hypothetical protein